MLAQKILIFDAWLKIMQPARPVIKINTYIGSESVCKLESIRF